MGPMPNGHFRMRLRRSGGTPPRRLADSRNALLRATYPRHRFGRGTYGPLRVLDFDDAGSLEIGSFTSIAEGVTILTGGNHRVDWVTTFPFTALWPHAGEVPGHPSSRGPVTVGSDVWLGFGCTILSGVTIGHGAVVGAGAVVREDVAPYSIVVGNPAAEVRKRFEDHVIASLLEIAWWDWDDAVIARALLDLQSPDISGFVTRALAGEYGHHEP